MRRTPPILLRNNSRARRQRAHLAKPVPGDEADFLRSPSGHSNLAVAARPRQTSRKTSRPRTESEWQVKGQVVWSHTSEMNSSLTVQGRRIPYELRARDIGSAYRWEVWRGENLMMSGKCIDLEEAKIAAQSAIRTKGATPKPAAKRRPQAWKATEAPPRRDNTDLAMDGVKALAAFVLVMNAAWQIGLARTGDGNGMSAFVAVVAAAGVGYLVIKARLVEEAG